MSIRSRPSTRRWSSLPGFPPGERKEDGTYPEGSINFLVDKRLKEMSKKLTASEKSEEKKEKKRTKITVKQRRLLLRQRSISHGLRRERSC